MNLMEMLAINICPYVPECGGTELEQQMIFDFEDSIDYFDSRKERVVFLNRLDSIDSVLSKNLFSPNSQLFEIVSAIREIQDYKTSSLACITIDDPNLYSFKYGHIRYRDLVDACKKYGAKCCIAAVPIDLWYFNKDLIKFFHDNCEYIGLCTHGVLHSKKDLERNWSVEKCISYINYGLEHIKRFERKTGLTVSRLIVPPHERLSKNMLEAFSRTEITGVITAGKVNGYTINLEKEEHLAGMLPINRSIGGVPVLLRDSLLHCARTNNISLRQRMKNRAMLNQAILFESHHKDFKNTDSLIEGICNFVSSLGARWATINEIESAIVGSNHVESMSTFMSLDASKSRVNSIELGGAFIRRWICMTRDWLHGRRTTMDN